MGVKVIAALVVNTLIGIIEEVMVTVIVIAIVIVILVVIVFVRNSNGNSNNNSNCNGNRNRNCNINSNTSRVIAGKVVIRATTIVAASNSNPDGY